MTTLTLTRKSGVTVTFEPEGAKTTVTTRWPDGASAAVATVPTTLARRVWATEVKGGAKLTSKTTPKPEWEGPPPGTYAFTAWAMVKAGLMDGDEADRWKDEMKERDW